MTAQKVGEFKVVAVDPIINNRKGNPENPTTVRLTLENGEKVLGCKTCDYASRNAGSMFKHVKQHAVIPAEPAEAIPESAQEESEVPVEAPVVKAVMSMTVGEFLSYVAFLEADGERPEALRARAEAAEARADAAETELVTLRYQMSRIKDALG